MRAKQCSLTTNHLLGPVSASYCSVGLLINNAALCCTVTGFRGAVEEQELVMDCDGAAGCIARPYPEHYTFPGVASASQRSGQRGQWGLKDRSRKMSLPTPSLPRDRSSGARALASPRCFCWFSCTAASSPGAFTAEKEAEEMIEVISIFLLVSIKQYDFQFVSVHFSSALV